MTPDNHDQLLSQEEINELLHQENPSSNQEVMDKKLEMILDFPLEISVRLGNNRKTIDELKKLTTGAVVELERFINEPVDVLVNGKLVAQGEVVTIGENFGIRITSILGPEERVKNLG